MTHTTTHTFAILEVTPHVFQQIKAGIVAANQCRDRLIQSGGKTVIDMQGIALAEGLGGMGWIACSDQLPGCGVEVQCFIPSIRYGSKVKALCRVKRSEDALDFYWQTSFGNNGQARSLVTHWQPMAAPPTP